MTTTTTATTTANEMPALFARAIEHLAGVARDRNVAFDVHSTTFASLAPLVAHVPRGPLVIALAAVWAARAMKDHGAFWFPQREAPLGAALGLPDALLALAPIELVQAALEKNALAELDERASELRDSLTTARNDGVTASALRGETLGVEDYRALFDPAFVHFLAVDEARATQALARATGDACALLADAIAASVVDPVKREALESAWLAPLTRLDGAKSLGDHARREPRAIETFVRLSSAHAGTGAADESFWADVVLNGAAAHVLGDDDTRLLGVFRIDHARALVPSLAGRARFYVVDASDLAANIASTSAANISNELREIATRRRDELTQLRTKGTLAFRRLTEAELPHEALAARVSEALRR